MCYFLFAGLLTCNVPSLWWVLGKVKRALAVTAFISLMTPVTLERIFEWPVFTLRHIILRLHLVHLHRVWGSWVGQRDSLLTFHPSTKCVMFLKAQTSEALAKPMVKQWLIPCIFSKQECVSIINQKLCNTKACLFLLSSENDLPSYDSVEEKVSDHVSDPQGWLHLSHPTCLCRCKMAFTNEKEQNVFHTHNDYRYCYE